MRLRVLILIFLIPLSFSCSPPDTNDPDYFHSGWFFCRAAGDGIHIIDIDSSWQSSSDPDKYILAIPGEINGKPVVGLDDYAFSFWYDGYESPLSILIPDSVRHIGENSFRNVPDLETVIIGSGISVLNDSTFTNCPSLASVAFSSGLEIIGDNCFTDCDRLVDIVFPPTLFEIGEGAFQNCELLSNIDFNDNLVSIGAFAFSDCTALISVELSPSLTNFDSRVFNRCDSLEELTVPVGNSSFCSLNGVLYDFDQKKLILYPDGKPDDVFTIPDSVSSISDGAFTQTAHLESVILGSGMTELSYGSFSFCTSLISVDLGDNLQNIGEYAFYSCELLAEVQFGSQVTKIGESSFVRCKNLSEFVISDSIQTIGDGAFAFCSGMSALDIGQSLSELGNGVFYGCDSLRDITVDPDNMQFFSENGYLLSKDGRVLYEYAHGRTDAEVSVPEGIEEIRPYAFSRSTHLAGIVLPSTLANVGDRAFRYCSALAEVTILAENPPELNFDGEEPYLFSGCSPGLIISVPQASVPSYREADGWTVYGDIIVNL